MQSFCDLETDSMQAARFAPPAAPTPAPAADSWLTRLARHLGASAVDQTERFISPAIRCPQRFVQSHRGDCCVSGSG